MFCYTSTALLDLSGRPVEMCTHKTKADRNALYNIFLGYSCLIKCCPLRVFKLSISRCNQLKDPKQFAHHVRVT